MIADSSTSIRLASIDEVLAAKAYICFVSVGAGKFVITADVSMSDALSRCTFLVCNPIVCLLRDDASSSTGGIASMVLPT